MAEFPTPGYCPTSLGPCHKDQCNYSRECELAHRPQLPKLSLEQLAIEARRENGLRKGFYPGQVARGKMTREAADYHQHAMNSIVRFLEWCVKHESAIRGAGTSPRGGGGEGAPHPGRE